MSDYTPEELQLFQLFFRLSCSAVLTLIERLAESVETRALVSHESVENLSKLLWSVFWAFSPHNVSEASHTEDVLRRSTHTYIDFLVSLSVNPSYDQDLSSLTLMAKQFVTKKLFATAADGVADVQPPISAPHRHIRIYNLTFLYVLKQLQAFEDDQIITEQTDTSLVKTKMRYIMTTTLDTLNHRTSADIQYNIEEYQATAPTPASS